MSLINQVLQDLERRRAAGSDDLQVTGQVRAVAGARHRMGFSVLGWLLLSLCVALAAYVWSSKPQVTGQLAALWAPFTEQGSSMNGTAVLPAAAPGPAQPVLAQVEAALMVPVFQLSDELSVIPAAVRTAPLDAAAPVTKQPSKPAASLKRVAEAALPSRQRREPAAAQTKPVAADMAISKPNAAPPQAAGKTASATEHAPPRKANPATATAPADKTEAVTVIASPPADADAPEQTVIPRDVELRQIEKQARQLTAYERAESAFRQGVASLRQGHMAEAEAHFRSAIKEDRSHHAAQQALVGILIDAGRFDDAEAVLAESLGVNPRQPKQAMILARLQVERGDLQLAIQTLQNVKPYAGTDPTYRSFLAAVLQRAKRHEQAVAEYRDALALAPRNPVWMMGLGISLRALGEDQQARQAFGSAAAIGTLEPRLQAFVEQQRRELERVAN